MQGLSEEGLTYAFNAIPDKPPTIALAKDPEAQQSGSLQLNYKMEDDYGVVEAKACSHSRAAKPDAGEPRSSVRPARDGAGAAASPGQERRRADHQGFRAIIRGPAPT